MLETIKKLVEMLVLLNGEQVKKGLLIHKAESGLDKTRKMMIKVEYSFELGKNRVFQTM